MIHIEDNIELIKTVITNNISTKLTAIAAAYADGITLAPPKKYYVNEVYVLDPTYLPAIQIIPDTTETAIPANKWDDDTDNIIIIAHNFSYDNKPETLSRVSYRYAKALSQIIIENHTLSANTYGWSRVSINYGSMISDGNILKQQIMLRTRLLTVRTV